MSGKNNKRPFGDEEEDEIGFRDPAHHAKNDDTEETDEKEKEEDINMKDEDDAMDDDDDPEEQEHGWHTFDMDNPDESL